MTRVVLATRNQHKVEELREILAEAAVEIVGLDAFPDTADVVEDGITFEENALLKAGSAARAVGLPALADDSGLCVELLGGSPGIFSARWSGGRDDRANVDLLLAQLSDVRDENRAGAFVCAAALVLPDGRSAVELGRIPGRVARAPRGNSGFGYDPIFVPDGQPEGGERTLAEYRPEEKNAVSHRFHAFRALVPHVRELLTT